MIDMNVSYILNICFILCLFPERILSSIQMLSGCELVESDLKYSRVEEKN